MKRPQVILVTLIGGLLIAFAGVIYLGRIAFGPAETETSFRQRLQTLGVLDILVKRSERAFTGKSFHLRRDRDFTPDDARRLDAAAMEGYYVIESPSGIEGIEFDWGGADAHYGIVVMRNGKSPTTFGGRYVHLWGGNVWYFSESGMH
jgi:hypothetical protein